MKKLVLIFSGGGAKAAFQVGAWKSILKNGINYHGVFHKIFYPHAAFGVSAGALNATMIAMGKNKELFQLWDKISGNPDEVFKSEFIQTKDNQTYLNANAFLQYLLSDLTFLDKIKMLFPKKRELIVKQLFERIKDIESLASNEPLFEKIKQHIHLKDIKSKYVHVGSVSLTSGQYIAHSHLDFTNDLNFQKAVLASSTIPLVFAPVQAVRNKFYEYNNLVDGGLRNVSPLGDAVKYVQSKNDNHEYYFLIVSTRCENLQLMTQKPSLLNTIKRSIYDIAMDEVNNSDLTEFLRINELVKQANAKGVDLYSKCGRKLKAYKVKIIQPLYELGSALNFSKSLVSQALLEGYNQAQIINQNPHWD